MKKIIFSLATIIIIISSIIINKNQINDYDMSLIAMEEDNITSLPKTKVEVTYDCNGGTGGGSEKFISGQTDQAFSKSCTKKGFTQVGWKRSKSKTTKDYSTKESIDDKWIEKYSPKITLYAHWESKKFDCSSGTYLPKLSNTCIKCLANYYCPGGKYSYNKNKNQGIKKCSSIVPGYDYSKPGSSNVTDCYIKVKENNYIKKEKDTTQTPCGKGYEKKAHNVNYNSKSTCDSKSYKCSPGQYLPKNKTKCANCIAGYYCEGGKFKSSKTENKGLTKCPKGYEESPESSTKKSQCYMNVSKNKYVKIAKDSTPTACPSGSCISTHTVKYGKTSGPCKCCEAPTASVSSERDTGAGLTCWKGEEKMYKYDGENTFTIKGCKRNLHGFMCYRNPYGSNCVGQLEYNGTPYHQNNGYGHMAFNNSKWTYYRSKNYVWVQVCNESNKCKNYYEKF